jgi:hypothetical protein
MSAPSSASAGPLGRFATAITCIDGRAHGPVTEWARQRLAVDYVDLVTEPGAPLAVATGEPAALAAVLHKVRVSTDAHAADVLVVSGHAGCAADPVSPARHREHIRAAIQRLRTALPGKVLIGVWVDDDGRVHEVQPVTERVGADR